MRILKLIYLSLSQVAKQLRMLFASASVATSLRMRQRRVALGYAEAERLDRIRNPSKYLGRS
jgi:hypothetical protein